MVSSLSTLGQAQAEFKHSIISLVRTDTAPTTMIKKGRKTPPKGRLPKQNGLGAQASPTKKKKAPVITLSSIYRVSKQGHNWQGGGEERRLCQEHHKTTPRRTTSAATYLYPTPNIGQVTFHKTLERFLVQSGWWRFWAPHTTPSTMATG